MRWEYNILFSRARGLPCTHHHTQRLARRRSVLNMSNSIPAFSGCWSTPLTKTNHHTGMLGPQNCTIQPLLDNLPSAQTRNYLCCETPRQPAATRSIIIRTKKTKKSGLLLGNEAFTWELRCSRDACSGQGVPSTACGCAETSRCVAGRFSHSKQRDGFCRQTTDSVPEREGNR
jgi:hypothetical protein